MSTACIAHDRWPHVPATIIRPRLAALALATALGLAGMQAAHAADLSQVWQAAVQNDRAYAAAFAARAAVQPRREQAASLWRPQVGLSATVGLASNQSEARGAQFSAPGLGTSADVGFNTSVNNGTATRWAVSAVLPLYNPQRRAQQRQLVLSTEVAELEWHAARQALMVQTAQRYFDLALAGESLRVLEGQMLAVQRAATEAQDRFTAGAVPITDTQEAQARLAGMRAQRLSVRTDLELQRGLLADSTGIAPDALRVQLPAASALQAAPAPLAQWLAQAEAGNPGIQMRLLAVTAAEQEAAKFSLRASPTVDLVAQAGHDRLSGRGDFGSAANSGSNRLIGVQVSVPLFTGGYRDAKEEEALRRVDQARAELTLTRQQVAQAVRESWQGLNVGSERVRAFSEGLAASQARRDATALGRQVGHRTTQDLLNAENDHAAATLALTQARVALLLARLRLASLAGTLDEAALRATDAELAAAT